MGSPKITLLNERVPSFIGKTLSAARKDGINAYLAGSLDTQAYQIRELNMASEMRRKFLGRLGCDLLVPAKDIDLVFYSDDIDLVTGMVDEAVGGFGSYIPFSGQNGIEIGGCELVQGRIVPDNRDEEGPIKVDLKLKHREGRAKVGNRLNDVSVNINGTSYGFRMREPKYLTKAKLRLLKDIVSNVPQKAERISGKIGPQLYIMHQLNLADVDERFWLDVRKIEGTIRYVAPLRQLP